MADFNKPFDNRLTVLVGYKNQNAEMHIPFSGAADSIGGSFYMSLETIESKRAELEKVKKGLTDSLKQKNAELIEKENAKTENMTQHSLINPYAMIRLSGGISSNGTNMLIDSSIRRPWYEVPNSTDNSDIGYSKVPTTARIIEWGRTDPRGRTPYQYQDFVFCKYWNKIPNNRMITLRRYAQPILDNLNTPADNVGDESNGNDNFKFPPLASAITYFGEGTDNSLTDILKFKSSLRWADVSASVWDMQYSSDGQQSTNDVLGGAGGVWGGLGAAFGGGLADALNALSIYNGQELNNGLMEKNGLGPDPYADGPYENRIKGPVNRIDSVKRREAGMEFEMSGMEIKFHYVARPIGGINSKAILLDILSNFMVLGSASAVFFGGAHRFRGTGRRFPTGNQKSIKDLYKGKLFGKEGAVNSYVKTFTNFYEQAGGFSSIVGNLFESAKALINNIVNAFGGANPFNATKSGQALAGNIENAVVQKMHTGMTIPYISGMRALLVGEPVGDWHLTIGNPLNPIAMIGNLICTGVEVEFNEEAGLGPDDFPLEFTITVSLEHGMPRDRDAIESMFNRGSGRIYELPDRFNSSADFETTVDKETGKNNKQPGKIMNSYATTVTSRESVILNLPNSQDQSTIHQSRVLNNKNVNTIGFSNKETFATRVPYHPAVEWITKKGLK